MTLSEELMNDILTRVRIKAETDPEFSAKLRKEPKYVLSEMTGGQLTDSELDDIVGGLQKFTFFGIYASDK